jgi:lipid-binding SYLF domain-containing protein
MSTLLKLVAAGAMLAGCTTTVRTADTTPPPPPADQAPDLVTSANATLDRMIARDPGLRDLLNTSAGYAIFPEVGKGGFIVGGALGHGVLYRRGVPVGNLRLGQVSVGAQAGGETFAELIVFRDDFAIERVMNNAYDLGAGASAVALTDGAAAATPFNDGIAVFVVPRGGLMVEVSVAGQQLRFEPRG